VNEQVVTKCRYLVCRRRVESRCKTSAGPAADAVVAMMQQRLARPSPPKVQMYLSCDGLPSAVSGLRKLHPQVVVFADAAKSGGGAAAAAEFGETDAGQVADAGPGCLSPRYARAFELDPGCLPQVWRFEVWDTAYDKTALKHARETHLGDVRVGLRGAGLRVAAGLAGAAAPSRLLLLPPPPPLPPLLPLTSPLAQVSVCLANVLAADGGRLTLPLQGSKADELRAAGEAGRGARFSGTLTVQMLEPPPPPALAKAGSVELQLSMEKPAAAKLGRASISGHRASAFAEAPAVTASVQREVFAGHFVTVRTTEAAEALPSGQPAPWAVLSLSVARLCYADHEAPLRLLVTNGAGAEVGHLRTTLAELLLGGGTLRQLAAPGREDWADGQGDCGRLKVERCELKLAQAGRARVQTMDALEGQGVDLAELSSSRRKAKKFEASLHISAVSAAGITVGDADTTGKSDPYVEYLRIADVTSLSNLCY